PHLSSLSFSLSLIPPPPLSTLFPYTTLFRSADLPLSSRLAPIAKLRARLGTDPKPLAEVVAKEIGKTRYEALGAEISPVAETCRSEEHTSELQSLAYLVCRLLLEKKKTARRL